MSSEWRQRFKSECSRVVRQMGQCKQVNQDEQLLDTRLNRCLTTFDITLLGIGHMVGSGVYVLTASVAKEIAGPAIVLSYIITGFASLLAALCYAEFAVRFPKAGSAYSYAYLALGEFCAFVVGWNMIMENVIGVAAVSRSCSAYVDSLLGGRLHAFTLDWINSSVTGTWRMTDVLTISIVASVSLLLRFGIRTTSYLNNALSLVNVAVIVLLLLVGGFQANLDNWRLPGRGFLPFGWKGVFAASGSCFYAFVGFESVAAAGEEAKNPQKSIPLATLASMAFATASYVGVSAVLTLMQPYDQLSGESGLPDAIGQLTGGVWAKWVVVLGACCGMGSVLIGTLYALTRIMYAMSDDALLPRSLGQLHDEAQVPLRPMYMCAAFAAILAAAFPLTTLVETMSIGTLLAYTLVSASVIILRYRPCVDASKSTNNATAVEDGIPDDNVSDHFSTPTESKLTESWNKICDYLSYFQRTQPAPRGLVPICVCLLICLQFVLCWEGPNWYRLSSSHTIYWLLLIFSIFLLLACIVAIAVQPQANSPSRYRVPLVPLVPALSIIFNVTLMANLSYLTWARLIVWMQAGLAVYLLYTVRISPNPSEFWRVNCDSRNWGSLDSQTQNLDETEPDEENEQSSLPK